MSQCNSEGVAEFIRLVEELKDFAEDMSDYNKKFIYDNSERIEKFGDKVFVSETQLDFIRELYNRVL